MFLSTPFSSSMLDSENTAVTLSALLASLNSCCNPWIYMIFSGHLLQDFAYCFPCCHKLRQKFKKEDSDSSIRRTTLLTKITNRSPTCSSGIWKDTDNSPKSDRSIPLDPQSWSLHLLSVFFELLKLWHQVPQTECVCAIESAGHSSHGHFGHVLSVLSAMLWLIEYEGGKKAKCGENKPGPRSL